MDEGWLDVEVGPNRTRTYRSPNGDHLLSGSSPNGSYPAGVSPGIDARVPPCSVVVQR